MTAAEHFVALVGFPRSGTTVLTALLDAHPDVTMYYEPWNSSPKKRPAPPESLADFCAAMEKRFGAPARATRFIGFKETVTYEESRDFAVRTLDNVARETESHLLWIFRDPIHCFFSRLEGARKWWGRPDAHFSAEGLEQYLRESIRHLRALLEVTERHRGTIVAYDALAAKPETTLTAVMESLGLAPVPAQLDYYKAGPQPDKVMGDPNVAERPSAVSNAPVEHRRREVEEHRKSIDAVLSATAFDWFRAECARLSALPAVASAEPGAGAERDARP